MTSGTVSQCGREEFENDVCPPPAIWDDPFWEYSYALDKNNAVLTGREDFEDGRKITDSYR